MGWAAPKFSLRSNPGYGTCPDRNGRIDPSGSPKVCGAHTTCVTRYDKIPENFLTSVKLASAGIWMRFNESMAYSG
jgi:hypothetical protein